MNTTREQDGRIANELWDRYSRTRDPRTRDAIVHQFERLAFSIANRFAKGGPQSEDLCQVAMIGLVKAVDRFDPATRNRFSTFATPTIVGEIKRYFRDNCWSLHVPRGMQELVQHVNRTSRDLSERLGRTPTAAEIAARLEVSEESVQEAQALTHRNHLLSLDGEFETSDSDRPSVLEQYLGEDDKNIEQAESQVAASQALTLLCEPLRQVIQMRYLQELSQRDVARRLGVSQMKVSRLERQALNTLRQQLAA